MDDHFSWSDTAYAAFGSCLACFNARQPTRSNETSSSTDNQTHNHIVRSIRSDELEGLLVDSGDDAETLSLHSNPGRPQRRKKLKSHPARNITLFGWNLFGKRKPPIQLPDDDGEEGIDGIIRPPRLSSRGTSSSSTLDSDAPQLSPTLIDSISPELLRERALAAEAAEAEERRLKEERRQRRREKREFKRAAIALAAGGDGDFEGFQGSGADYFHSHPPTSPSLPDSTSDSFGPFVGSTHAESRLNSSHPDHDDGDDTADLDGGVYTRKAVGSSLSGSDSRSRTSASRSDVSHHHPYQPINQPPMPHPHPQLRLHRQDRPSLELTPSSSDGVPRKKRSKKSKSSTTSESQTPSIRSPASPHFPHGHPEIALVSPGLRYDGLEQDHLRLEHQLEDIHTSFPSSGLNVGQRKASPAMGAFLANTTR